jgi:hypothetical protein
MKKLALILLAFALAGGTVAAQPEGLYLGGEIGISDFNADPIMDAIVLRPYVGFAIENESGIEFDGQLGIPFWPADYEFWLGADLYVLFGYNIDLGSGTLNFGIENWTYLPLVGDGKYIPVTTNGNPFDGDFASSYKTTSYLQVGAKYTHNLDFGDIYFGVYMPFVLTGYGWSEVTRSYTIGFVTYTYTTYEYVKYDPFDLANLNFSIGVDGEGWGVGVDITNYIKPETEFFQELGLFGSFDATEALSLGIYVWIPLFEDGIDYAGIGITPDFSFAINENFELYGKFPIGGVGSKGDISIGLVIGGKYSF